MRRYSSSFSGSRETGKVPHANCTSTAMRLIRTQLTHGSTRRQLRRSNDRRSQGHYFQGLVMESNNPMAELVIHPWPERWMCAVLIFYLRN